MSNLENITRGTRTIDDIYDVFSRGDADTVPLPFLRDAHIANNFCPRRLWYRYHHALPDIPTAVARLHENIQDYAGVMLSKAVKNVVNQSYETEVEWLADKSFMIASQLAVQGIKEAPKTWHLFYSVVLTQDEFRDAKTLKTPLGSDVFTYLANRINLIGHVLGLERAYVVFVGLNSGELLAERYRINHVLAKRLISAIEKAVSEEDPLNVPEGGDCERCPVAELCLGHRNDDTPVVPVSIIHCRQCRQWSKRNGIEVCTKTTGRLPHKICKEFSFSDNFLPEGFIDSGKHPPKMLTETSFKMMDDVTVKKVSEEFEGRIVGGGLVEDNELLGKYPEEDCELVWEGKKEELSDYNLAELLPDGCEPTRMQKAKTTRATEYGGLFLVVDDKLTGITKVLKGKE